MELGKNCVNIHVQRDRRTKSSIDLPAGEGCVAFLPIFD